MSLLHLSQASTTIKARHQSLQTHLTDPLLLIRFADMISISSLLQFRHTQNILHTSIFIYYSLYYRISLLDDLYSHTPPTYSTCSHSLYIFPKPPRTPFPFAPPKPVLPTNLLVSPPSDLACTNARLYLVNAHIPILQQSRLRYRYT